MRTVKDICFLLCGAHTVCYVINVRFRIMPPTKGEGRGGEAFWFQCGSRWRWRRYPLLVFTISLEPVGEVSTSLHGNIIRTSLRADKILVTLT